MRGTSNTEALCMHYWICKMKTKVYAFEYNMAERGLIRMGIVWKEL